MPFNRLEIPRADRSAVCRLRSRLKLTQADFAARYGFTMAAVQDWEHGRYQPNPTVSAYLAVIAENPVAVREALVAAQAKHSARTAEDVSRQAASQVRISASA